MTGDNFMEIGGQRIRVEQIGGIITLDYNHEKVHLGEMYEWDRTQSVADGGTMSLRVVTGTALNMHFSFGVDANGGGKIYLYESPGTVTGGTAITLWNMNRDSASVLTGAIYHTPTVTNVGTVPLINGRWLAGGTTEQTRGGASARSNLERILKAGKSYLLQFVNLSGFAGTVSFYGDCYEEPSEF